MLTLHIKTIIRQFSKNLEKRERRIKKRFTEKQKRLWEVFVFLLRFSILAIPLHLLLWMSIEATSLQYITAIITDKILSLTNTEFTREGIMFVLKTTTGVLNIEISRDCVGWKSMLALIGLIFAVRNVRVSDRVKGILIGLPLIFLGNIIRLVTTMYITTIQGVHFFNIIHSFLWQWGLIFIVLSIWIVWLNYIAKTI